MSGGKFTRSVPSSPRKRRPEVPLSSSISKYPRNSTTKGLKPLRLVKSFWHIFYSYDYSLIFQSTIVNAQSNSQSNSQSRRSIISDNTNSFQYSGESLLNSKLWLNYQAIILRKYYSHIYFVTKKCIIFLL